MKTLITGSIAYDTIMVFPDRFRNHLLADQLHILNVCFLTPEMRREYGGTAGNIAYNLRLLGEDPLLMASVGEDAAPRAAVPRHDGVLAAGARGGRVGGRFRERLHSPLRLGWDYEPEPVQGRAGLQPAPSATPTEDLSSRSR